MKPTSCFSRGLRVALLVLFALAPVLSAGTCDCCERGNCSESCPPRQASVSSCGENTAGEMPSCWSLQADSPVADCRSVGEDVASDTCRCMLEPKELWSASKDHDELLLSYANPSLIVTIHTAADGLGSALAATAPIVVNQSGSPPPRRPVRILYGVWRD